MRRPLTLLLAILLVTTAFASGTADAEPPTEAEASVFTALANSTVSCSLAWPSAVAGCWLERPLVVLGGFELAVGIDAQAALRGEWEDAHLAPYVIAAFYFARGSAWLEVRLPELSGIPVLGTSDTLRLGFTYRIPP